MNMDSLISIVNKMHDIFNVVGTNLVQLPQIVVVGSQSSGKSSVLESLVGRDFLPRGTGIVTRCPLILQLIYTPKDCSIFCAKDVSLQVKEWGKFLHTGDKIFADFQEIRKEMEAEMERKSGCNKGISSEAINLKIFSPYVTNLTLVDLPGITKVPVGDQPEDIEMQVRQLILQYISNPNAIILAVTAANTDLATSESIKIAKECDPEGSRTLAVITKLDLMDAGTDATDVLCGRVIPVKLGIIGVVNRSQQDIIDEKNIHDAIKDEAAFLQKTYPALSSKNGTEFLRKRLNNLLINHIRSRLPHLKSRVNNMISQYQTILQSYGNTITDPNRVLLQIITKFSSSYCSAIEGTARNIETSELSGGARICYIFHEIFGRALENIDPLSGIGALDILTAIRNATGTRPALFIPEVAFELLVKRQIQRLSEPSLRCVQLVYDEMQRIVRHCGVEFQQEIRRFPKLHEKIMDVVTQLLQQRLPATNMMVENLISIELAYINTKHSDFHHEFASIQQNEIKKENDSGSETAQIVHPESNSPNRNAISEIAPKSETSSIICEEEKNLFSSIRQDLITVEEIYERTIGDSPAKENQMGYKRLSKSFQYKSGDILSDERCSVSEAKAFFPNSDSLPAFEFCSNTQNFTAVENKECEIIKHLIHSYFVIIKKNIQDSVPKAIMHFLVNYIKDNLQSELVTYLYKPEYFTSLLQESDQIANGRKEATEMLQVLQKSNGIINEIRDISL